MNTSKGFTLIELLVVIAVIGILAAVVLASLGSARNKAKDKAIVSDLLNIRTEVQSYFATNGTVGTYSFTWCPFSTVSPSVFSTSPKVKEILTHANAQAGGNATGSTFSRITCYANGIQWSVAAVLNEGAGTKVWCVDSTGKSNLYTTNTAPYTVGSAVVSGGMCV